nr:MAG TPA: transcriptional regulator [Caudoviricetes sp.]
MLSELDKKTLVEQAITAIKENNLWFFEDIVAYLPICKGTFYRFFPVDSEEYNQMKELLLINRTRTKIELRKKLMQSDRASELLAIYRLIGTKEERIKLMQNYVDVTSKGEKIDNNIQVEIIDKTSDKVNADTNDENI